MLLVSCYQPVDLDSHVPPPKPLSLYINCNEAACAGEFVVVAAVAVHPAMALLRPRYSLHQ